jgi:hypothetical protein
VTVEVSGRAFDARARGEERDDPRLRREGVEDRARGRYDLALLDDVNDSLRHLWGNQLERSAQTRLFGLPVRPGNVQ